MNVKAKEGLISDLFAYFIVVVIDDKTGVEHSGNFFLRSFDDKGPLLEVIF